MADKSPELYSRWIGDLFIDSSPAAKILDGEWFATPTASSIYIGAAGQGVIHLALRTPAQMTLSSRTLYP